MACIAAIQDGEKPAVFDLDEVWWYDLKKIDSHI